MELYTRNNVANFDPESLDTLLRLTDGEMGKAIGASISFAENTLRYKPLVHLLSRNANANEKFTEVGFSWESPMGSYSMGEKIWAITFKECTESVQIQKVICLLMDHGLDLEIIQLNAL